MHDDLMITTLCLDSQSQCCGFNMPSVSPSRSDRGHFDHTHLASDSLLYLV